MHRVVLIAILLLLASPVSADSGAQVTFKAPAQAGGNFKALVTWVFLTFDEDRRAVGDFDLGPASTYVNHTWSEVGEAHVGLVDLAGTPRTTDSDPIQLGGTVGIALGERGPSGLYVEAETLELTVQATLAEIQGVHANQCLGTLFSHSTLSEKVIRPGVRCPAANTVGFVSQSAGSFSLYATGIRRLEWHNAGVDCASEPCPDGGPRILRTTAAGQASVVERQFSYDLLELAAGTGTVAGLASSAAWGAPAVDSSLDGWVRLPLADCTGCPASGNETLWAKGDLDLETVRFDGSQFSTRLGGDIEAARFDESPVDPVVLAASGSALALVLTGGALLLKWLLAGHFTRLAPDRALDHPRRRQIHEYVGASPGAAFREVARGTGIAHGALRHHLTTLVRAGQLVERRHGNTLRIFHNHGRYDASWTQVVGLRQKHSAELWNWVSSHVGAAQKDIIKAMNLQYGWHPATTQHRLGRLVKSGVLQSRTHGRFRRYYPVANADHALEPSAG